MRTTRWRSANPLRRRARRRARSQSATVQLGAIVPLQFQDAAASFNLTLQGNTGGAAPSNVPVFPGNTHFLFACTGRGLLKHGGRPTDATTEGRSFEEHAGRALVRTRTSNGHRKEGGFTLIELTVVVMILGLLLVIALPGFLGARIRAQYRAAESDLHSALVAAKTIYTSNASYASADSSASGLVTEEPELCYTGAGTQSKANTVAGDCTAGPVAGGSISVSASPSTWAAARMSQSGTCFVLRDNGSGTTYNNTSVAANCTGTWAAANATFPTAAAGGW